MRTLQTRSILIVTLVSLGATLLTTTALGTPKGKPKKTVPTPVKPVESDAGKDAKDPKDAGKDAKDVGKDAKDAKDAKTPTTTVPATPAPTGGAGGLGGGSGTGGGSGEPKPDAANEPDVDSLRQEYLSLRDELFKSRARANAVASQLYSTRVSIKLTYTSGRFYSPAKSSVRLDGASVYEDTTGAIANDDGVRFDGYVAPGRHVVTFRIEATGKDDDSFTSATEATIVVKAVGGKDLIVGAKAHDSGDMAYSWKRNERGTYGLGIDVGVKTAAHADGDVKGKKK